MQTVRDAEIKQGRRLGYERHYHPHPVQKCGLCGEPITYGGRIRRVYRRWRRIAANKFQSFLDNVYEHHSCPE